jgi:MtN3 and saliva related transmembrane protein
MDNVTLIGVLAAICTTLSFVPQVIKIFRTKETHDLSLLMYAIFSVGVFLWLCYGLMIKSMPITIANSATLVMSLYILIMKLRRG